MRVLPINLSEPCTTSSIYYEKDCRTFDPEVHRPDICRAVTTEELYRKDMENLLAHGVTSPTLTQYEFDLDLLETQLKVRQEVGMKGPLYYRGYLPKPMVYGRGNPMGIGNPTSLEELALLKDSVKKVIEVAKRFGFTEVYFYGMDEARLDWIETQIPAWKAIHEAGGKVFVAGHAAEVLERVEGDVLDVVNTQGHPTDPKWKELVDKAHRTGMRVWSYANPQPGVENPEVYRRNYGLVLWKGGFDGAADYAYLATIGGSWNDFDPHFYRDHHFIYPTDDGVVDTIAWEGYREGIDDLRYVTTLMKAIEEARQSGNATVRGVAQRAEDYLSELDVERDLDTVRREIVEYILQLTGKNVF